MKLPPAEVAVVLGSGLSDVATKLVDAPGIPYSDIDGFPVSTVVGHSGTLHAGSAGGREVLVFAGRVHLYEGHDVNTVVTPIRMAIASGCRTIILTNAAGWISDHLSTGDICVISDHLNLTGMNPLTGPEPDATKRFIDMTNAYDRKLCALAHDVDPDLKDGVYGGLTGPTYETPAEVKMLRTLGADMVGMSTVLETIAARHAGARVLGISVLTNKAAGSTGEPVFHDEVTEMGLRVSGRLAKLVAGVLSRLGEAD